ncbi:hypothetical protein SAMN02910358_02642 [Lachnospiraceae bacterium XBB1006]|nr:hypothetical protein SAMN02910358_02642 [Lachnospiraceae bacterium XBB1006]
MQLLKLIPVVQGIVILFAYYQSLKAKEKIYRVLDNRVFWGLAVLFNLWGTFSDIIVISGRRIRAV